MRASSICGVKVGVEMSQLYYQAAESPSYRSSMKSKVFIVQRDVNRWGKRIDWPSLKLLF